MPITFTCPSCQASIKVGDAATGRQGKCPNCKGPITVPGLNTPAAPTLAPPADLAPVDANSSLATAPPAGRALWRRPWVLVLCGFALCYLAGAGTVAWLDRALLYSPSQLVQQARNDSPPSQAPTPTQPARPAGETITTSDRDAFIAFAKKNAQKPSGLEIIKFGPPRVEEGGGWHDTADPGNKPYIRNVAFRCDVIDLDLDTGAPVSREDAVVFFSAPGKISQLRLNQSARWWR